MSKDIPVIGPMGSAVTSMFGLSQMGQDIKIPSTPAPPPPPAPTEMADPGDILKKKRREQSAAALTTSGRSSTILSDAKDRLGG